MSIGRIASAFAAMSICAMPVAMAADGGRDADREAIRAAAAAYQQALGRGDGAAMAKLWTADGDIVDAFGERMAGRETAAATSPSADGEPAPTTQLDETSLRFLSADVAIEDGTVKVTSPGSPPLAGRFTAVWVKQNGQWLLSAVREDKLDGASGPEALAELDWMVGEWAVTNNAAAASGEAKALPTIEVSARWNSSKTFLIRDLRIIRDGRVSMHVLQRIGWDPLHRELRGWMFSSDGSHGEAVWGRDGDAWLAKTTVTSPDGSQHSALNVYTFDGKDTCHWRSFATHAGGDGLPPIDMTLTRTAREASKETTEP